MADGLNKVILIGNLGQDPELRHTQSGTPVMTVRIATTESYLKNDKRHERTEWHTIVIWGNRAMGLAKILSKGARIGVEGKLQTRSWEDKQGNKRYSTEVLATNVILCGGSTKANKPEDERDAPPDDAPGDASFVQGDDFPF